MNKIAIDTNILLYSLDEFDPKKQSKSIELIAANPYISSQNISELANVCLNKWRFPKDKVKILLNTFLTRCEFIPVTREISLYSLEIMSKYDFQFFDSLIVTSALTEGCEVLYTEDMQHGLLIEKTLKLVNPFK